MPLKCPLLLPDGGHIQVIFGPMFSGKTTELLRRVKRYRLANCVCRVVKYRNDTRYDNERIATHDGVVFEAVSAVRVYDVMNELRDAQVVGIDEGQFFDDVAECSEKLANQGKIVIVCALDGDFTRMRFRNILDLCPIAESYEKLSAVCKVCGEDASFTKRLSADTNQEVIGGEEIYSAVCRNCYFDEESYTSGPSPSYGSGIFVNTGRIELIFGSALAGKTTELMRRYERHVLANRDCKVVTFKDARRNGRSAVRKHLRKFVREAMKTDRLEEEFSELMMYEVVLIDEGHRFSDVVECSERLANQGKIVIVAACDGDSHRQEYGGGVLNLIPLAEDVLKLRAVCDECKGDAAFSKAFGTRELESDVDNHSVRPVCRDCYMDPRKRRGQEERTRLPLRQANLC